jgi:hypothetical protein
VPTQVSILGQCVLRPITVLLEGDTHNAPLTPACAKPQMALLIVVIKSLVQAKNLSNSLNSDAVDFFEQKLLAREIVEFGRTGRLMIRDGLGVFQCAAVLQIGRDAGGAKAVTTDGIATVSDVKQYRQYRQ